LPEEFVRGLLRGAVEPDELPDYRRITITRRRRRRVYTYTIEKRVPHHDIPGTSVDDVARSDLVRYYRCLAAFLFRRGQYYESGRALGRALHYIQDSVLPGDVHHEEIEHLIDRYLRSREVRSPDVVKMVELALERTIELLQDFVNDITQKVDSNYVENIRRKVLKFKILKILLCALPPLLLFSLAFSSPLAAFLLIFYLVTVEPTVVSWVLSWIPRPYWEAFRLGIIRIRLHNYRTAL